MDSITIISSIAKRVGQVSTQLQLLPSLNINVYQLQLCIIVHRLLLVLINSKKYTASGTVVAN